MLHLVFCLYFILFLFYVAGKHFYLIICISKFTNSCRIWICKGCTFAREKGENQYNI